MDPRCLRYHVYKSVSALTQYSITKQQAHLYIPFVAGRLYSTFFRMGQTIETFRGKGIYQPAVDTAIDMLNQGCWVREAPYH
jgi:hypothetical protein